MKLFRKLYGISLVLLLALSFAGCTEKQEGENWNLSFAGYPSPLDRKFTPVNLAGDEEITWRIGADMCQIDEDTVLLNLHREKKIANSAETIDATIYEQSLCLYDFKKGKIKKEIIIPEARNSFNKIRVCQDKIISKDETGFYWIDKDLTTISEKIFLPEFMLNEDYYEGYDYAKHFYYDVSADLRYIIYYASAYGIHYYDRETGKDIVLYEPQFHEYYNNWVTIHYALFLPGDKLIGFEVMQSDTPYNKFVTTNLDTGKQWISDAEDIWTGSNHNYTNWDYSNPNCFMPLFPVKHYDDAGHWTILKVAQFDLNKQTAENYRDMQWEKWSGGMTPYWYNEGYLVYTDFAPRLNPETNEMEVDLDYKRIVIMDFETLTHRTVMQCNKGRFNIHGVTKDGRVLFTWYTGFFPTGKFLQEGEVSYICGFTKPIK